MQVGSCYHIVTPPNGKHWFVVAFPISETRFLLFPFTTKRAKSDPSCIIEPGDGAPAFIEHSTVIGYRDALELTQYSFEDGLKRKYYGEAGSVSDELLEKVLNSGLRSKFLKNKWKNKIREILDQPNES